MSVELRDGSRTICAAEFRSRIRVMIAEDLEGLRLSSNTAFREGDHARKRHADSAYHFLGEAFRRIELLYGRMVDELAAADTWARE